VRAYLALLGAGFQRQNTYRLALVAGLDVADALTYVWVLEGLFAVVWAPWFWELAEAMRCATSCASSTGARAPR
jgi:hypothetical protein